MPTPRTRPHWRPFVVLNSAMSLDGKIATFRRESDLSSPEDLNRVHRLRATVDGIMVGVGTLLTDNPKLTTRLVKGRNPKRIVVDSTARTPLDTYLVKSALETPTIVATTSRAPAPRVEKLQKAGVTVLKCGTGSRVSLRLLLSRLRRRRVKRLLLEGGGTLNWSMLSQGLVDEVSVAISPRIIGGAKAVGLVGGEGIGRTRDAVKLRLASVKRYGGDLVLVYRVLRRA